MGSQTDIPQNIITKIILEAVEQLDISSKVQVEQDFLKALSRAANIFILYSTAKASELASENNRKTVYAQDIMDAVASLGIEHFTPELKVWHSMFVEEKERKEKTAGERSAKKKKKDKPAEALMEAEGPMEIGAEVEVGEEVEVGDELEVGEEVEVGGEVELEAEGSETENIDDPVTSN